MPEPYGFAVEFHVNFVLHAVSYIMLWRWWLVLIQFVMRTQG